MINVGPLYLFIAKNARLRGNFTSSKLRKKEIFLCRIRLSEKFLSFHQVTTDEQEFPFYIILLN